MKIFDKYPENRLFSLDCLRGLDMLLLTVIIPAVIAVDRLLGLPKGLMMHCRHTWGWMGIDDIIMPCFIFMCGAAIPFSLMRRLKDGHTTRDFWVHVAKRFALLYLLGSIVQCNLLSLNPMQIHLFYNTLQVIGIGYVMAAVFLTIPSRAVQMTIPIVLAAAMGLIVHFCGNGDYSQTGNFAYRFDRIFWGLFLPPGQHTLQPNGYYCYWLPMLGCSAITQCGYECALVLRGKRGPWAKVAILGALAAALFVAGWLVSLKVPVIKHIYSLSFTLYATAWSVLMLDLLYVLTDIWRVRRFTGLIIVFGQNALAAYTMRAMFGRAFWKASDYFTHGLEPHFGAKFQTFANDIGAIVFLILAVIGWSVYKRYRKLNQGKEA